MRLSRATVIGGAAALMVGFAACASPGMPPGGPPDVAAPELVSVSPDTGAVRVRARTITLRFNEVVSERTSGTAGGATSGTLDAIVQLSPGDGRERVNWRRSALEIEPRDGFRPNTTYRLTLLPGLSDLRGNVVRQATDVVFSTGDSLSTGELTGAVFDWAAGRVAPLARVEAFLRTDTTFRWGARADSTGRFALRNLATGAYHVRAWIDLTPNRLLDSRESFDSVNVSLEGSSTRDLYVFSHDTIGPRIEVIEPADTTALRIRFDRPLGVDWEPDSTTFVLQGADSVRIAIGRALPAARYDSLQRVARATADSLRAAQDTSARRDTTAAPVRAPVNRPVVATGVATGVTAAAADTTGAPRFERKIPVQTWVVPLLGPLAPGEYRLQVSRAVGLTGTGRDSERQFTVRAPPAPTDTVPPTPQAPPRPPQR